MKKVILNNKERELEYKDGDFYLDGEHFDGHFTLWSFKYEPKTYLKESELSGEEWRKGGMIEYFRDNVKVYEQFCRTPDQAIKEIMQTLPKLQEVDWDKIKSGTKLYWENQPAIIDFVCSDGQGAFIIKPDGIERFAERPWAKEDWEKFEEPDSIKIDILDPHIWWWRK